MGKTLVVDDEVELKNILVESLNSHGYESVGAASGEEALIRLRDESFDVVLTDLMMPGMNGITLVQEGLLIDPHLVCIVMTGQGTIQTAVDAMKAGAFDYVLKPFRLQTLMPQLLRALNVSQMRLENLQLRETEQLRKSQKMEAIGQLAGRVAHDLNNLLTAINGYSSLALQRTNADERLRSYLEEIRKAGDRAADLTGQLLAFGHKQMLKPLPLNLNDVVSDMNKEVLDVNGINDRSMERIPKHE